MLNFFGFTSPNDEIFAEGSIDPMGLRPIWTQMADEIFGGRINTISTDIRSYTINLFHYNLLRELWEEKQAELDKFFHNAGFQASEQKQKESLLILLECILINSVNEYKNQHDPGFNSDGIVGLNKLKGLIHQNGDSARKAVADPQSGILKGHIRLGIHGRYKGTITSIGLINDKIEFNNDNRVWDGQIRQIFNQEPWERLKRQLKALIPDSINPETKAIETNKYLNQNHELSKLWAECLNAVNTNQINNFWLDQLELRDGAPALLKEATALRLNENQLRHLTSQVFNQAEHEGGVNEKEIQKIRNINVYEPFLTAIEHIFDWLRCRDVKNLEDAKLNEIVTGWQDCIGYDFNGAEAIQNSRLSSLLSIWQNHRAPKELLRAIVNYHDGIMKNRSTAPWVALKPDESIERYHNFTNNPGEPAPKNWQHHYYIPTLKAILNAMNQNAEFHA